MGTTPVYAFPYAGVNDPPNGPAQEQSLATAVENKIITVDAAIASNAAATLLHKRCLGGQRLTASTASFSAETLILTTGALALPANSAIEIEVTLNFNLTVGTDEMDLRFRDNNISGTVVKEIVKNNQRGSVPMQLQFSHYYETTVAETRTWAITLARFSGTGVIVAEAGTRVRVYADGSNTILTELP